MFYHCIKIIHIVSSVLLFGVGMTLTLCDLLLLRCPDRAIKSQMSFRIMVIGAIAGIIGGVIQPVTGFMMIGQEGLVFTTYFWVMTLVGYTIAGLCWLLVLYLQWQSFQLIQHALTSDESLPSLYKGYSLVRIPLAILAFLSLGVVVYGMAGLAK